MPLHRMRRSASGPGLVEFVGNTYLGASSGATQNFDFNVSGMLAGDLALALLVLNNTAETVSGFSLLGRVNIVNTSNYLTVYWKVLTAGDITTNPVVSHGGTGRSMAVVYRNATSVSALSSTSLAAGGNTPVITGATPSGGAKRVTTLVGENSATLDVTLPDNPEFTRRFSTQYFAMHDALPADYGGGNINVNIANGTASASGLWFMEFS